MVAGALTQIDSVTYVSPHFTCHRLDLAAVRQAGRQAPAAGEREEGAPDWAIQGALVPQAHPLHAGAAPTEVVQVVPVVAR